MEKHFSPPQISYHIPYIPGTIPNHLEKSILTNGENEALYNVDSTDNEYTNELNAPSDIIQSYSVNSAPVSHVSRKYSPAQIEVNVQKALGHPQGLGSLRNEESTNQSSIEKQDKSIEDMLKIDNILSLKEKFDHSVKKIESSFESPFSNDIRLDKDGSKTQELNDAKIALRKQMIKEYTQTGIKEGEEPRNVPKSVRREIVSLMSLSYEELEAKNQPEAKAHEIVAYSDGNTDTDNSRTESQENKPNALDLINQQLDAVNGAEGAGSNSTTEQSEKNAERDSAMEVQLKAIVDAYDKYILDEKLTDTPQTQLDFTQSIYVDRLKKAAEIKNSTPQSALKNDATLRAIVNIRNSARMIGNSELPDDSKGKLSESVLDQDLKKVYNNDFIKTKAEYYAEKRRNTVLGKLGASALGFSKSNVKKAVQKIRR